MFKNHCIYITFDENYFDYAKACLNSIKHNYPNHPKIIVEYKGKSNNHIINYLRFYENLEVITFNNIDYDLPLGEVGNDLIYSKFKIWTDIFDKYDSVLHLDCDTLILQPLDDIFLSEEFFCISNNEPSYMVRIFGNNMDENLNYILKKYSIKNPIHKDDMMNAGVFVLPKKYRTEMYHKTLLEIAQDFKDYIVYADQSIISLWCLYFNIPITRAYQYNFQTPFFSLKQMQDFNFDDIKILHFSGTKKPGNDTFEKWDYAGNHAMKIKDLWHFYLKN